MTNFKEARKTTFSKFLNELPNMGMGEAKEYAGNYLECWELLSSYASIELILLRESYLQRGGKYNYPEWLKKRLNKTSIAYRLINDKDVEFVSGDFHLKQKSECKIHSLIKFFLTK